MQLDASVLDRLRAAVRVDRLLDTAIKLIEIPSPTCHAGAVAARLAEILAADGFAVERPAAAWPTAPAVVARWKAAAPGRTLQFNGHLDTVHLPFCPPRVVDGLLLGSGASDMKGGIAAMCEAARAVRDSGLLGRGGLLITAHDLHEAPWGDSRQLDALIDAGCLGDGVLLPEYLHDRLPLAGRGGAVVEATIRRDGVPVHEVLGGKQAPNVIAAGSKLVQRLLELDERLSAQNHPIAGQASMFIGQVAAGEIFNQSPVEYKLAGSRRWLPGTRVAEVEAEYRVLLGELAKETGLHVEGKFTMSRDAFELDRSDPLVGAFQTAYAAVAGRELPSGAKPFVDDGNSFVARGRRPAITHGPHAIGAHTTDERCPIAELERVALVYAATAVAYCDAPPA